MSIGQMCRKILGPKYFKYAGKAYRGIFVNVKIVIQSFPEMPAGSHLLDIGGGDGELINHLKERFPDIKITMIDIAGAMGSLLEEKYRKDVRILPATSIAQYDERYGATSPKVDFILISDVVHHIVPSQRRGFFSDLSKLMNENTQVIFKDVEPGYFISRLSYWGDKYVSGDKTVELTSKKEITGLMKENFPNIDWYETDLFAKNRPNFSLVFSLRKSASVQ